MSTPFGSHARCSTGALLYRLSIAIATTMKTAATGSATFGSWIARWKLGPIAVRKQSRAYLEARSRSSR